MRLSSWVACNCRIDETIFVRLSQDDTAMYKQAFGRERLPEVRFRGDGSIEARLSQWWALRGFFAAMKGTRRQQGPWPAASRPAMYWIFGWDHHLDWSTRKPIRRRKKKRKPPQPDQTGEPRG